MVGGRVVILPGARALPMHAQRRATSLSSRTCLSRAVRALCWSAVTLQIGATRRTTVEESGRLWSGASRWAAYVERAPKRRSRVDQQGSVLCGGLGAKLLDKSQVRRRRREGEGGRQLRLRLG